MGSVVVWAPVSLLPRTRYRRYAVEPDDYSAVGIWAAVESALLRVPRIYKADPHLTLNNCGRWAQCRARWYLNAQPLHDGPAAADAFPCEVTADDMARVEAALRDHGVDRLDDGDTLVCVFEVHYAPPELYLQSATVAAAAVRLRVEPFLLSTAAAAASLDCVREAVQQFVVVAHPYHGCLEASLSIMAAADAARVQFTAGNVQPVLDMLQLHFAGGAAVAGEIAVLTINPTA